MIISKLLGVIKEGFAQYCSTVRVTVTYRWLFIEPIALHFLFKPWQSTGQSERESGRVNQSEQRSRL